MTETAKAQLEIEGKAETEWIPCLFNPDLLTISRSVTWNPEATPGSNKNAPSLTFGKAESGSLSFKLDFDTTDTGASVTTYTTALLKLMDIDATKKRPLWVRFHWGTLESFEAVVKSATIKFTYFASDGTPLRADADLALTQYKDDELTNAANYPLQNPTSGTPTPERRHRVQPGETLDRISYSYYGDSTQWRVIARRNNILDPLRLNAGRLLFVPEREVATRG